MSMTREEAIARILDHMEAHRMGEYPHIKIKEALDLALAALRGPTREMVERMRGCSDCQRKTCVSCRRFGWVPQRCVDCNDQDKWSPWNFCPVCGKPLTDEAVDMMLDQLQEVMGP